MLDVRAENSPTNMENPRLDTPPSSPVSQVGTPHCPPGAVCLAEVLIAVATATSDSTPTQPDNVSAVQQESSSQSDNASVVNVGSKTEVTDCLY
jgi:hypothetical protein